MKNKLFLALLGIICLSMLGLLYRMAINKTFIQITVGPKWVNQAQFAGMFVASTSHIYKRYGLNVAFKEFTFETNQIEDLLSGKTDFALVSAEELILARQEGKLVKAIAAFYQISPYVIATLPNSGIRTPADFKDKILGCKGGKTEEKLLYELLLANVGLKPHEVTIKKIGFDNREIDDLKNKLTDAIDVYRTDQLYFFDKEQIPYTIIYPEQYGISIYNDILITREEMLTTHPDIVKKFIQASILGWEQAIRNPQAAIDSTLQFVTSTIYKNREYEMYILEKSIPLIHPTITTKIGMMNLSTWNKIYTQMNKSGFITKQLNISDMFTTEFLP